MYAYANKNKNGTICKEGERSDRSNGPKFFVYQNVILTFPVPVFVRHTLKKNENKPTTIIFGLFILKLKALTKEFRNFHGKHKQIKGSSPFNFLESFFILKDVNTRRKDVGLIPATYTCTKFRQRSLKVSILKSYNCLKGINFLPQEVKSLCDRILSKHLHMISQNFIFGKKKVVQLMIAQQLLNRKRIPIPK